MLILRFLLYLWQLPQNILGLILILFYNPERHFFYNNERISISSKISGGISLGRYVIMSPDYSNSSESIEHEYGHSLQSKYLGPFYLLIIGLPSLLWAWWWNPEREVPYYKFYTESWADKLGGVKRNNYD